MPTFHDKPGVAVKVDVLPVEAVAVTVLAPLTDKVEADCLIITSFEMFPALTVTVALLSELLGLTEAVL